MWFSGLGSGNWRILPCLQGVCGVGREGNKVAFIWPQNLSLVPPANSSHCPVLTAQHGDSRSSQIVLCQQQTNWDYYLRALTCQGSCLTQALIIVIIYFLPDVLRARSKAVSLGAAPVKHKDLFRTCGAGVQLGQQGKGQWVKRFILLLRYICSSFSPIQKKSGMLYVSPRASPAPAPSMIPESKEIGSCLSPRVWWECLIPSA